jgi:predicted nucleotidyltransferase component of viral defense system
VSIDQNFIGSIAADLGVNASLVEKDWYAMRIVAVVAAITTPQMHLVFAGGTSLSKGYGLIQRFSEDLDFKVAMPSKGLNRPAYRDYRKQIIQAILTGGEDWSLAEEDIEIANGSRFFQCKIAYQHQFEQTPAIRPHVKLEVTFESPALPIEIKSLQSFVAQAQGTGIEVPEMPCISPIETAANKLSALAWRIANRDRDSLQDDPALIRHLHDLAALESIIVRSRDFAPLALICINQDASRDKTPESVGMEPLERLYRMLDILEGDSLYAEEYERFVLGMSYAAEASRPDFHQALQAVRRLIDSTAIADLH